jgi:hypothetical protein
MRWTCGKAEAARVPGVRCEIRHGGPGSTAQDEPTQIAAARRALRRHGTWTGRTRRGRRGVLYGGTAPGRDERGEVAAVCSAAAGMRAARGDRGVVNW